MVAALINAADIFEFYNSHRYLSSVSFLIKNGQGNTRPSLRFPALRYALLFAVVVGTVHSTGFAVTATGGSTLFLILYELQNNCGDNRREKKAYCNGSQIICNPSKHYEKLLSHTDILI